MKHSATPVTKKGLKVTLTLLVLFFTCLPLGALRIWRSGNNIFAKLGYTLFGLPFFIVLYSFLALIMFSAFLPPLDLSVGDRADRTIVNSAGNYSATFINTARETSNAYELIQVEVEPGGGNDPHYHKDFEEHFSVLKGTLTVYIKGVPHKLNVGDSMTANRQTMHHFRNETKSLVLMTVKTTPAGGLEKTLRVAYGLINTGQLKMILLKTHGTCVFYLDTADLTWKGCPLLFRSHLLFHWRKLRSGEGRIKISSCFINNVPP